MQQINIGDTLTCAVTGKTFTAQRTGCTFNYAQDSAGRPVSDEGVELSNQRAMLDRTKPVGLYVSQDGRHVTGWKGDIVGNITRSSVSRGNFGGSLMHVRVLDMHGGHWYGKGAGRGMYITLRPCKTKPAL